MTLTEIANIANDYTDENFSTSILKGFANFAISKINVAVGTDLPLYNETDEYVAINDNWQHAVVVPYVCWSIKMNDSSLNEANVYMFQFEQGIEDLKKNKRKAISEEYQGDGFQTTFTISGYSGLQSRPKKMTGNPYEGDD